MTSNLFENIPESFPEEIFEQLAEGGQFRLERILSCGQTTPPDTWYDQAWDEWVVLLSGSAQLLFEGEADSWQMKPGDFVQIPAHKKHRVEATDASQVTVWLALHYQKGRL